MESCTCPTLPAILLDVDDCNSRKFRTSCRKLAQCGWASNTTAGNIAGNIARCHMDAP